MNGTRSNDTAQDDAGTKLAQHVATGLASLVGIAIVACSAALYSNSIAITELQQKCAVTRDQLFELHARLSEYPSAGDLNGCRSRIEAAERYQTLDEHRMSKLERAVEALSSQPQARPDPFTGTEGRELRKRIEALEKQP